LPHTVEVFLKDLDGRTNMLTDACPAQLIEIGDAGTMALLAHDLQLRKYCMRPVIAISLFRPYG
jgi:hypothetical protein